MNKELLWLSVKFDPELSGTLLRGVLQINTVNMGQVNRSENGLLLCGVMWYRHIALSGGSDILHSGLCLAHRYESRSERKPLLRESSCHKIHEHYSGREI